MGLVFRDFLWNPERYLYQPIIYLLA